VAELLFWPALVAYGEAAFAYFGEARRPGLSGRLATWGVRIGWLAQTALLALQAARADGFPWASWAGSLNLFVWLVVTVYLVWGCRARYRLLGLVVTPLVAALFVVARLGGGTELGERSHYSNLFLVLHVGLVLAAFAGFTLAAALATVYLFQERRLKRHDATILRLPAPSLETLDSLQARVILYSLPALTLGIAAGLVRLEEDGGGIDALMAVTAATWLAYGGYLGLRVSRGWRGRRAAYLALAGFVLVVVVRLLLTGTHFG
jgi:ABC-type transport system involved in cytochrome c biogenesis permease subunit